MNSSIYNNFTKDSVDLNIKSRVTKILDDTKEYRIFDNIIYKRSNQSIEINNIFDLGQDNNNEEGEELDMN